MTMRSGDFVRLTAKKPWQVRFIELMPMGVCAAWPPERFLPGAGGPLPRAGAASRGPQRRRAAVPPAGSGRDGRTDRADELRLLRGLHKNTHHGGRKAQALPALDAELALRGLSGAELEAAIRQGILMKPARHRMDETGVTETHRGMFAIGG